MQATIPPTRCCEAWVDGTALPNPGRMSIGLVLLAPDGTRQEISRQLGRSGCNNEAEACAIAAALAVAEAAGWRRILIRSDSRFAVDCLNGRDDTATPHLASLLADIRRTMADFESAGIIWLPRHRNHDADRLARAAQGLPPKTDARRK